VYNQYEKDFNILEVSKMKRVIIIALLAGGSLMAAESAKAIPFSPKAYYEKNCIVCHGAKGEKSPQKGIAPLAGRDATILARTIRAYRDQDKDVGAFTMHKDSEVMKFATISLSDPEISALAKYISELK
jgi:cytochrome c553